MNTRHYFGTDGVRGRVGEPPITPEIVLKLGYAAGRVLAAGEGARTGEAPRVLIGKDTRVSGYLLEAALEAGLSAAGVDVDLTGPLPTPALMLKPSGAAPTAITSAPSSWNTAGATW